MRPLIRFDKRAAFEQRRAAAQALQVDGKSNSAVEAIEEKAGTPCRLRGGVPAQCITPRGLIKGHEERGEEYVVLLIFFDQPILIRLSRPVKRQNLQSYALSSTSAVVEGWALGSGAIAGLGSIGVTRSFVRRQINGYNAAYTG